MNQTASAPGSSLIPDWTGIITTGHLVLVAVLAVLVLVGLVWGIRLARRRRTAEREVAAYNAEVEAQPPAPAVPAAEADPIERRSGVDRRQSPWRPEDEEPPMRALSPEAAAAPTVLIFDRIPDAAPAITATPALEPDGGSFADGPVTQLKGLGPKLAQRLAEEGITTVGQIAALTDDEAAALDARLGPFTGRMARDRWQEQSRFLAAGDQAGFEAVFGRL